MAALALAAIAAAPASPVDRFAGRYVRAVSDSDAEGIYRTDQVVEIARIDTNRAFFKLTLPFARRQECSLSGIAKRVGSTLVYRETQPDYDKGVFCTLRISAPRGVLTIDDKGGTCYSYCSGRGSLSDFPFVPLSAKRPIKSLTELRASQPYRSALDDWKAGRIK